MYVEDVVGEGGERVQDRKTMWGTYTSEQLSTAGLPATTAVQPVLHQLSRGTVQILPGGNGTWHHMAEANTALLI